VSDVIIAGFDYGSLPPETQDALRLAAADTRSRLNGAGAAFEDAGRRLIEAKSMLTGRGQFGAWVKAELGLEERTAQNYMNWARFMDGKPKALSGLPADVIYRLAAKSAPAEVVQQIVAAAESGAVPPVREIKDKLDDAHRQKEQAKRDEEEKARCSAPREKKVDREAREARIMAKAKADRQERIARSREIFEPLVMAVANQLDDDGLNALSRILDTMVSHRDAVLIVVREERDRRMSREPAPVAQPSDTAELSDLFDLDIEGHVADRC
jgi:hypothetical protein